MDEAALIPTLVYVLLTALLVAWAIRSLRWLRVTETTVALTALLMVFESGVAYEGVKRAIEY
ncbi:hypothetical protein [Halorussus aquaticus]|uniref:Cation:proton antiporter n=1 Tax=Halorussus aquaticus TaxID=2953748 RepID=A0ABD5PZK3_9EURY|nr:hypothetical protein [Halorussus aquaticus]